MHCASLGEFEQGRPLLENLKANSPSVYLVVTFFSPSGFNVIKHDILVNKILYLPLDTKKNASRFVRILKPDLVLWVKYEYWYHFLTELKNQNIPTLLVSGIFRKNQLFFKFYGSLWRKLITCFTKIFVQDQASVELLDQINVKNVELSGDTRFDRVLEISKLNSEIDFIPTFCEGADVIVAGSTWEEDEVLLIHFMRIHPHIKLIIAPHEIDKENLESVRHSFPGSIYYSELIKENYNKANTLIMDNVGMLSTLYKYANICFVGGGFGAEGVHNVLEPAVYGKPVLFGPEYEKYIEAGQLIEYGGADEVKNALELEHTLDLLLSNPAKQSKMGNAAREFVEMKAGATRIISNYIYKNRLLTN
ncbi:MAG: glycosyltransferase N-terminal domain-containing protein [Ginsengibacter sp.]